MAAIDFPNSPTVGQLFSVGNTTWRWDGSFWAGIGNAVPGPKGDPGPEGPVGPPVTTMSSSVITTVVSDKSSSYSITSSDRGSLIRSTGEAITITINDVLSIGDNISFAQYGSGQITFGAGPGVSLNSKGAKFKTSEQYAAASVFCTASGQYWLVGSLI
jgi:hypothetical protein